MKHIRMIHLTYLLAPVFASMLVKRAFETDGVVEDCETVNIASSKYRNGQDHISAFIYENITKTSESNDKVRKNEVYQHFKIWFQESQGNNRKMPKGEELYAYMDKKFGKHDGKVGWRGIKINYPEEDVEEEF